MKSFLFSRSLSRPCTPYLGTRSFSTFTNNSLSIGNTPLVKLNRITKGCVANVYAKIEGRNPGYSVKCRIGSSMIEDAEKRGILAPGKGVRVIEGTSGNTGIGLAMACASRGYELILTMPDSMSMERRKVLAALGAKIVLTPGSEGMRGAVKRAEELHQADPEHTFVARQFENAANPAVHERTTGPEIWRDLDGKMDVFVAGVGTGGTITGVSRFWKNIQKRPLHVVAVEPQQSPLITQLRSGAKLQPGPHKIQGIGANFIPPILDVSLIDRTETATLEESIDMAKRLGTEEGILCGISCGAAASAAIRMAKLKEFANRNIVVVLPDSGERYLSTVLYEDLSVPTSAQPPSQPKTA